MSSEKRKLAKPDWRTLKKNLLRGSPIVVTQVQRSEGERRRRWDRIINYLRSQKKEGEKGEECVSLALEKNGRDGRTITGEWGVSQKTEESRLILQRCYTY